LDHADALRIKDQELLQKYDELSRSIFAEMFGDPAKNEKGWDKIKLENCLEKGEKISYGIVQPGDEVEEGIPVIRVRDFESMHVRRDRVRMVHPNCESKHKKTRLIGDELLIGCVGSVGKIALVDESLKGYNIVRATARVRVNPNKINRTFLAFALSHQSIQNHFISETRTVSQPTLNIKQIGATEIIAPPIATQRKFNLIIENIFTLSKLVKSSSVEMLFSSLLQNSFFLEQAETVELRVN
jgi:type I restriction enzyme S subunit